MPSLTDSLANFVTAVTGIFTSLLASVFSVFQAVLALVQNLVTTVVNLSTSILALGIDLCQGVIGFAFGAFSRRCGCGASSYNLFRHSELRGAAAPRWRLLFLHDAGREGYPPREGQEEGVKPCSCRRRYPLSLISQNVGDRLGLSMDIVMYVYRTQL
jgi:hypothetical protein